MDRLSLIKQLTNMFEGYTVEAVKASPVFQAKLYLRDSLIKRGFRVSQANEIMSNIEIVLPGDLFDDAEEKEATLKLLDTFSDMLALTHKATIDTFGDVWPLFIKMLNGANLKLGE